MAVAANTLVTMFRRRYSQCDSTTAYEVLNIVDEEILLALPHRKTSRAVATVAGQAEYALLETELRIWAVRYYNSAVLGDHVSLAMRGIEELYEDYPTFRDGEDGTPMYVATDTESDATGIFVLAPAPEDSSLVVTDATNATPIVVTTNTHGMSDGDQVYIQGVVGNTAANGRFYVNVLTATTFELYSDSTLSTAVAGSGSYSSGGVGTCTGHPMIVLDVTTKASDFSSSETVMATPKLRDLYVDGMCRVYSKERDVEKYPYWNQIFLDRLADQQSISMGRLKDVKPTVQPAFRQRNNWR